MAKIPPIKRFRSEDYPDIPANFLSNLSLALEAVVGALDRFINWDNVSGQLYDRVTIPKSQTISPSTPFLLPYEHRYPPVAVVMGGIWLKGADAKTSLAVNVTIEWDYDSTNRQIIIKALTGISQPLSADYQITLLAFAR